jgi:putative protease
MADIKIGKVIHFYDKICVVVIELTAPLKVGDRIKFDDFEQTVSSMQVEHEQIQTAKKGQSIGLKTDQPVKKGSQVLKVA